jgi:enamine deaminase RidA (YjgF/YER057c/UK114 family)
MGPVNMTRIPRQTEIIEKMEIILTNKRLLRAFPLLLLTVISGCTVPESGQKTVQAQEELNPAGAPEWFLLRPEVEKAYGYSHAVKIGDDIKISGAVSMDAEGTPTAVGDLEQQMKNAYSDLEKVLNHYGYTFDDVIVENVYTTDMAKFLEVASYRNSIYTKQFPTGTWVEVKGLALPEFMIEIELEAYKSK